MLKMKEKSTLVLGKPKMFTKHPWIKVYTNWQFLPLKLQNWQNSPWVFKTLKFTNNTLVLCMIDNLEQFDNFEEFTILPPKLFKIT